MATQHDASKLYQQAQDAAAEAWERAATNQTAYMHTDDDVQAAEVAAWMDAHPDAVQNWRRFRAAALTVGGLCLLGAGLGTFLASVYLLALAHDGALASRGAAGCSAGRAGAARGAVGDEVKHFLALIIGLAVGPLLGWLFDRAMYGPRRRKAVGR